MFQQHIQNTYDKDSKKKKNYYYKNNHNLLVKNINFYQNKLKLSNLKINKLENKRVKLYNLFEILFSSIIFIKLYY